jgi:hypothetical protein
MRRHSAITRIAPVAVPFALSVLVAACFGGPLVTPAAPAASSPAPTPPASPSTGPASPSGEPSIEPTEVPVSPSQSASGSASDLPFGEVDAGTYRNARFEPPVTLTVGDGWYATILNGFFDLQQRRGTPEVIAVQVANVDRVVDPDGKGIKPDDAAHAARIVARNPDLEVLGQSDSRLGGLEGRVVEVRNASGKHAGIVDVPPGRLGIDDARALWIAFLDTPEDGVIAVMVGGPSEGWDEALAVAEPVLETIAVGE